MHSISSKMHSIAYYSFELPNLSALTHSFVLLLITHCLNALIFHQIYVEGMIGFSLWYCDECKELALGVALVEYMMSQVILELKGFCFLILCSLF